MSCPGNMVGDCMCTWPTDCNLNDEVHTLLAGYLYVHTECDTHSKHMYDHVNYFDFK